MIPKIVTENGNFIYDRDLVEAILQAYQDKVDSLILRGKRVLLVEKTKERIKIRIQDV